MTKLELVKFGKSPNPEKKIREVFRNKKTGRTKAVDAGQAGADDYTKTHDHEQRARYLERHGRGREDWSKPDSPGALSKHLLWGESTSLLTNLAAFRRRFNL